MDSQLLGSEITLHAMKEKKTPQNNERRERKYL